MRQLANHVDIKDAVKEAWCFDCLYEEGKDIKFWVDWSKDASHKLFVHSTGAYDSEVKPEDVKSTDVQRNGKYYRHEDGTFTESNTIKKQTERSPNVQVEIKTRTSDHNTSPGIWIKDLVEKSSFLS